MGAAAFRNKVIADPAVLYMEYAQEAEAAKGPEREAIPPNCRTEPARFKACIATSNVYGADSNRMFRNPAKLALRLNTICKGME